MLLDMPNWPWFNVSEHSLNAMRDGSATKELIDRTALRLFAEKGVRETTIRDIAASAGIAEGTMYRHYGSKDELASTLFLENYAAVGRRLRQVEEAHETTRAKLDAMIRYFCSVYETDRTVFSYLFLTRHRYMQLLTRRMPNPYLVFRRVIRAGMARGEIPDRDPDVATSMVMGVILQVIDSRLLGGRIKQSISELADSITAACFMVFED